VGTGARGVRKQNARPFGAMPGRPHVVRARQRVRGPEGLPPGGEDQPGGWHSRAKIDASKDFYRILQVRPYDGQDAIKAAYRRLLKLHHPDLSSSFDATRRMQEINEAYEVLSDAERRRAYVLLREAYLHPRVPAYPDRTASFWPSYEVPFDHLRGLSRSRPGSRPAGLSLSWTTSSAASLRAWQWLSWC